MDREAVEFRAPLRAYWRWGTGATAPEAESFLACSHDNVVVSSLSMEGNTVVLRLFESRGRPAAEVELRLPFAPVAAAKTDCLLRRLEEPVTVEGDVLRCALSAWEIATFALEI